MYLFRICILEDFNISHVIIITWKIWVMENKILKYSDFEHRLPTYSYTIWYATQTIILYN